MKKILILSIAVTTFILVFVGQAFEDHKIKVSVKVSCEDKITNALISSYIKRELRNFSDVDVIGADTEKLPPYTLRMNVREITTEEKIKTGDIIYSAMFVENILPYDLFEPHFKGKQIQVGNVNGELMDILRGFTTDPIWWIYYHCRVDYLGNNKIENLQDVCKEIVALFDTDILEVTRQQR